MIGILLKACGMWTVRCAITSRGLCIILTVASSAMHTTMVISPSGMLQAESYIGSDVSGANVTVQWSTPRAQGTLDLTTNADGIATGGPCNH
jgi:hypothetical protein